MKKYSILTLSLVFAGVLGHAQQENSVNANKSSEPMMANGIPYSQYKAQVEAQMKQQEINNRATIVKPVANPDGNNAQNKATNVNPAQNAGFISSVGINKVQQPVEVNTTTVQGGAVNSSGNKEATTSQDPSVKQSPANNTKVEEKPAFQGTNGIPVTIQEKITPTKQQ